MHFQALAVFKVLNPDKGHDQIERLGRQYYLWLESKPNQSRFRLVVTRTGPEGSTTTHTQYFNSYDELLADGREKIYRRLYHGYDLIYWDENFPLLDYMRQKDFPTTRQANFIRPGIQLELPLRFAS